MSDSTIQKVLLLVEDSAAARTATRFAALLAERCGAAVTAFSVIHRAEVRAELEGALAEAATTLGKSSVSVETARVEGDLVREAAKKAREGYDVTVLGTSPRGSRESRRLSLAVWQIAKTVETPVMMVPESAKPSLDRILLCTGGERYIEKGARFVATLARCARAQVSLLHILPVAPEMYRAWSQPRSSEEILKGESRLARQLRGQLEIFRKEGVAANLVVEESDGIERTIFDVSRRVEANLIVVGSSPHRGALRTSMLGNVPREVITRSSVPVLVVRSSPTGLLKDLWQIITEG